MHIKISEILHKRIYFFLLLLLSPGFWWVIFQPINASIELVNFPINVKRKVTSIFSDEKLRYVEEMRWNAFSEEKEELISRLYYNKAMVLVDNSFEYLSLLSPRIYFQAGDGTEFSPPGVEPVPFFAFVFWVFGLIKLAKQKEFKPLFLLLAFPLFGFLAGARNLVFLFPVLLLYIYIASQGIELLINECKKRNLIIGLLIIYGVFIISRALWLTC
ncbi:hypothetical protein KKH23_02135 [Patescibacteria group bacterium]|nr:hypothetical protein [Patescibacteria group bacterium]MBU0777353.1 hypothetical protein [Patescibacteria group bacterium]MBU0845981.1 hypothetical protein [Patescibacteria group bacterium]MBU0922529.1 hypothetical protein [Patescibacteria group bacterium]MBU1066538.1 hypothetical protein [Patescibacteria group bacterium]